MVRGGFAGRVGGAGIVGGLLGEVAGVAQGAVDFVGAYVQEAGAGGWGLGGGEPGRAGCFEEGEGADDVGLDKFARSGDAAIHVGFGGEVDDGVDLFFGEDGVEQRPVADVPVDEAVAGIVFEIRQVCGIAGVG